MTETRADALKKGDVLLLRGERWTVLKAKVKGKHVRLVIDGRKGTFDQEVKARSVYDAVGGTAGVMSGGPQPERVGRVKPTGPLLSPTGAQTRWATEGESTPWDVPASKAESKLIDHLGARLVAVEVEGGRLVVPPVDDGTIFGHLLTMHGRRFDGVTVAEARAWSKSHDPAGAGSASEVVDALSLQRAYGLHQSLHEDFAALERPHWHREVAPR